MGEEELKKPGKTRSIDWIPYLLVLVFGAWLFLLFSNSLFSSKYEIQQEPVNKSEIIAIEEPINYPLLRKGDLAEKGDSIGIKSSLDKWESVNILEVILMEETNLKELNAKTIGLRSGVDTIDYQLYIVLNELKSYNKNTNSETSVEEQHQIQLQRIDNTKRIAQAENEQREIQLKYAKKNATIEALLAASNRVKALREEHGKYIPVKIKKKEKLAPIISENVELNENIRAKVSELLSTIKNWKAQQLVYAPTAGKLIYPNIDSKDKYKIEVSINNPLYYFTGFTSNIGDTIVGNIELPGGQSFLTKAYKDALQNRYIIADQDTVLSDQYKYNSNARVVFKHTGHSYYSMIKNLLYHK